VVGFRTIKQMAAPNELSDAQDDLELFEESLPNDPTNSSNVTHSEEIGKNNKNSPKNDADNVDETDGATKATTTCTPKRQSRLSDHLTSILVAPVKFLLPSQQGNSESDDFAQTFEATDEDDSHMVDRAQYQPILAMDDDDEEDAPKRQRVMLGYNAYHGPYARWLPAEIIDNIEHFYNNNPLCRA
jgi:hypothetical protein